MNLNQRIITARKAQGMTQQELATLTRTDLRTIQRIESGQSQPRAFTLKAIGNVLPIDAPATETADSSHFLQLFCLSCFSYLVIPYVHFLVPGYLLKINKNQTPQVQAFAKKVIREQIYWVIATMLIFLIVLLINFTHPRSISYLIPFFGMYLLNAILIATNLYRVRTFAVQTP